MLQKRPCPPGKSVKERTLNHTPPSCTFSQLKMLFLQTQNPWQKAPAAPIILLKYFETLLAYCLREQTCPLCVEERHYGAAHKLELEY